MSGKLGRGVGSAGAVGLGLTLLAALWLLVPAAALGAQSGGTVRPPSTEFTVDAPASNGYRLELMAYSGGSILLIAERHTSVLSEASYSAPAKVRGDRIDADLGNLGHVSLRFVPDRKPKAAAGRRGERCEGRPREFVDGTFRGRLVFHGELGFTDASVVRARGTRDRRFKRVCRGGRGRAPRAAASVAGGGIELVAASQSEGVETEFIASLYGGEKFAPLPWSFQAVRRERSGRISISRSTYVEAGLETASVQGAPGLSEGTFAPVAPFTGTATYRDVPGQAPEWTGTLTGQLPGVEPLPLTGVGFKASLHRETAVAGA